MDSFAIQEMKSLGIYLDSFISYHNHVVDSYISLGVQIEAIGTIFAERFVNSNIILIHPHPIMPFDALIHVSQFNCKVMVGMPI